MADMDPQEQLGEREGRSDAQKMMNNEASERVRKSIQFVIDSARRAGDPFSRGYRRGFDEVLDA